MTQLKLKTRILNQTGSKNYTTSSFVYKIPNSEEGRTNTKEFLFQQSQQGEAVPRGI
jgi:hypothetical protein